MTQGVDLVLELLYSLPTWRVPHRLLGEGRPESENLVDKSEFALILLVTSIPVTGI